jgi:hypothetical protein
MAISPDYPGLCATVVVDDEPLKEYDDDDDATEEEEPNTISKYVSVDSDPPLSIRYIISQDFDCKLGVWAKLTVDGDDFGSVIDTCEEIESRNIEAKISELSIKIDGKECIQRVRFSKLDIGQSELTPCIGQHS